MKIIIDKEKFIADDDYLSSPYDVHCEMNLDENANAYNCLRMVYHAMKVDGYAEESIKQAFKDFVEGDFD